MQRKHYYLRDDIATSMNYYNTTHLYNFGSIDLLVLSIVSSGDYTNDLDLANLTLSSQRTVKRSINKLCALKLIDKHLGHCNTKILEVNSDTFQKFLNKMELVGNGKGL